MTYQILKGNSLDLLPTLADNSIDAIVTDPPYELGFMGKTWDNSGIAYSLELWQQCLRVLKPGGHLLAFSGSRTYHRMVVSIEDAGFEIRDMISWISNKTFPKSLNISKAIDKAAPRVGMFQEFAKHFAEQRNKTGLTQKEIAQSFLSKTGGVTGCVSNWENGTSIPTIEQWKVLQRMLQLSEDWLPLISRTQAEREVIGERKQRGSKQGVVAFNAAESETEVITAPSTPEAQQWQGWGTGLKPTVEPIVMARKPVEGTVANNVLTHGTGGLNIDASRIKANGDNLEGGKKGGTDNEVYAKGLGDSSGKSSALDGRWPANLILDEQAAELLDEQSGQVGNGWKKNYGSDDYAGKQYSGGSFGGGGYSGINTYADSGGASRFFYVAKASKRDRNEGLEDTNAHPTVKPTELMRYLVKLITPLGGTVLDPFTGSGSTGKAAILEGFDFIGIELTEDYWPIIDGRLKHAEAKVAEAKEKIEAQPQGLF
jgi:DNA modification methylase